MPSRSHEIWLEMVRDRPEFAADLLRCVRSGLVPSFSEARIESGDLSEHIPAAYHADAVVTLRDGDESLAVIVEVQGNQDRRKHMSWPAYIANARARLRCPVVLLVVCPEKNVAVWARRPIPLGHPGLVLTPLVLGPEEVPVLIGTDSNVAPELTVVSAMVHGGGPDGTKILNAMLDDLQKLEPKQAQVYIDEVFAVLPKATQATLETLMDTKNREYKSNFARRYFGEGKEEGKAEGKAEGKVEAVLAILAVREIEITEQVRARISSCTDLAQLESWVRQAAVAGSADELFA